MLKGLMQMVRVPLRISGNKSVNKVIGIINQMLPQSARLPRGQLPAPKKRNRTKKVYPDREGHFLRLWEKFAEDQSQPVRQYVFHPTRKWKFDFAWPEYLVAVEIDGGLFQGGDKPQATGHRSITGVMRDMEKSNAAQLAGWLVLRFHSKDLDDHHQAVVSMVKQALKIRGEERGLTTDCADSADNKKN